MDRLDRFALAEEGPLPPDTPGVPRREFERVSAVAGGAVGVFFRVQRGTFGSAHRDVRPHGRERVVALVQRARRAVDLLLTVK